MRPSALLRTGLVERRAVANGLLDKIRLLVPHLEVGACHPRLPSRIVQRGNYGLKEFGMI
jgi:hypothetical protein